MDPELKTKLPKSVDKKSIITSPITTETKVRETAVELPPETDSPTQNDTESWPQLTLDDLNITFTVVGDLVPGNKLRIVDRKYFTADDSYLRSLTTGSIGQGRQAIISFLEHCHQEVNRNLNVTLALIKTEPDIAIGKITNFVKNMSIFLHNYDNMRSVYKTDASSYSRLGNIKDNFEITYFNFFKKILK
jgi:hypothetical protein